MWPTTHRGHTEKDLEHPFKCNKGCTQGSPAFPWHVSHDHRKFGHRQLPGQWDGGIIWHVNYMIDDDNH